MIKKTLQIILTFGLTILIFGLAPSRSHAQIGLPGGEVGTGGTGGTGGTNPPATGTLTIYLPAKELLTPDQLRIGNNGNTGTNTYTFSAATSTFNLTSGSNTNYGVAVACHTDNNVTSACSTPDRSVGYTITVTGFVKGGGQLALEKQKGGNILTKVEGKLQDSLGAKAFAPPFPCFAVCAKIVFPYRLTFKSGTGTTTLPKASVTSYVSYLQGRNNGLTDTFISSNENCSDRPPSGGAFLCMKENVKFETAERGVTGPIYTLQSIPLGVTGAINIQGNAAASGIIDGFNFTALTNAVAIGGSIPDGIPNASKTLQNYISQNATKFSWTNVKPQLDTIFAKRTRGTLPQMDNASQASYSSPTWYLNSSTNDPANAAKSSFSTPPEGKLWYTNTGNAFVRFPNAINFSGSGTIAVTGNLSFDGNITCDPGTRLGIIATGTINFSGSTINCGAYTSLASTSDIVFGFQVPSGNPVANGIFVAGHSVHLPSLGANASYSINYDSLFGSNPTVLYQELLKVIFSTSN